MTSNGPDDVTSNASRARPDGGFVGMQTRLAGAPIASPPQDTDFGSREYHVHDLEGHPWTFGTYLPPADRE